MFLLGILCLFSVFPDSFLQAANNGPEHTTIHIPSVTKSPSHKKGTRLLKGLADLHLPLEEITINHYDEAQQKIDSSLARIESQVGFIAPDSERALNIIREELQHVVQREKISLSESKSQFTSTAESSDEDSSAYERSDSEEEEEEGEKPKNNIFEDLQSIALSGRITTDLTTKTLIMTAQNLARTQDGLEVAKHEAAESKRIANISLYIGVGGTIVAILGLVAAIIPPTLI